MTSNIFDTLKYEELSQDAAETRKLLSDLIGKIKFHLTIPSYYRR